MTGALSVARNWQAFEAWPAEAQVKCHITGETALYTESSKPSTLMRQFVSAMSRTDVERNEFRGGQRKVEKMIREEHGDSMANKFESEFNERYIQGQPVTRGAVSRFLQKEEGDLDAPKSVSRSSHFLEGVTGVFASLTSPTSHGGYIPIPQSDEEVVDSSFPMPHDLVQYWNNIRNSGGSYQHEGSVEMNPLQEEDQKPPAIDPYTVTGRRMAAALGENNIQNKFKTSPPSQRSGVSDSRYGSTEEEE